MDKKDKKVTIPLSIDDDTLKDSINIGALKIYKIKDGQIETLEFSSKFEKYFLDFIENLDKDGRKKDSDR